MNSNTDTKPEATSDDQEKLMLLAKDYAAPAEKVGKALDAIERAQGGLWGAVKEAVKAAIEHGHNAETFTKGFAAALALAKIPEGSVRSYVPTAGKMLTAIRSEAINADAALGMTIAEARRAFSVPKPRTASTTTDKPADEAGKAEGEQDAPQAEAGPPSFRAQALAAINAHLATLDDDALVNLLDLLDLPIPGNEDEADEDARKRA